MRLVAEFEDALSRADEAVRRADTAVERAALEEAVRMYRGDLLPSRYEDWLASEREQLNQRFSRTLDRLIDVLEGRRDYRAAIDYAQRRLRHDQLEEDAYRRLMHLHALNHDRASALRVYHTCASMLEQELAVEPSPATREAYERLVRLAAMPAPALGPALESAPPLVGRQGEWTQLRVARQRAVSGEAHLVVITGEAGIGKSRLADELYVWAARQGIATAQTRAYAAEGRLSYAPVTDWLRSECVQPALVWLDAAWQSELARLLPELGSRQADPQNTGTAGPQRQRLFEAADEALAVGERDPGFARPAWPHHRQEPQVVSAETFSNLLHLVLATDQGRGHHGQCLRRRFGCAHGTTVPMTLVGCVKRAQPQTTSSI